MVYDFNERIDRYKTNSLKWELLPPKGNPMWVADMDFPSAPAIRKAVEKRAVHGVFGYSILPKEWKQSYQLWWKNRYNLDIPNEWLMFSTGVIPAISSCIRRFSAPGDKVIIQTPVYNMFFNCITNNGRQILENELVYRDGVYSMDFADLEEKMQDPQASIMLLCSPHNPTGNIWTSEDLERVGELAYKHSVLVICDEIHCDITDPGTSYIPFLSVSDKCRNNSIVTLSPSKSFNIAGLATACVCVPDAGIRARTHRALNNDGLTEPGVFAIDSVIAAYTKGGEWLDDLRGYIFENKRIVRAFLQNNLPNIRLCESNATYLLWLDCSQIEPDDSKTLAEHILKTTGLKLNAGESYGSCGRHFLRMNIACPREQLVDGLSRFKQGLV